MKEKVMPKIKDSKLVKHETKRNVLLRFILVLLVFLIYFAFVSFRYGISNGFFVTILTWSFFVFCTPIADAGFLLDFPIRLITKIRMLYSEIFVWLISFLINIYAIIFRPEIYDKTPLLEIFKHILLNPFPFYLIILVSLIGTFLSIYFGDELLDVIRHKDRKKHKKHKIKHFLAIIFFIIISLILIYIYLLEKLGIRGLF